MEYYSALKKRMRWRKLSRILLSEESSMKKLQKKKEKEKEKATYCMILTMWHPGEDKTMETVKDQWLQELGMRGLNNRVPRILKAVKLPCLTL